MTIKTKYNIGQEVWFIEDNKVCNKKITAIHLHIYESGSDISYSCSPSEFGKLLNSVNESKLFPTKEELLKSL